VVRKPYYYFWGWWYKKRQATEVSSSGPACPADTKFDSIRMVHWGGLVFLKTMPPET